MSIPMSKYYINTMTKTQIIISPKGPVSTKTVKTALGQKEQKKISIGLSDNDSWDCWEALYKCHNI